VEDDPETLLTLKAMGFSDPPRISATIRAWHHGRIGATRTEQGRALFTRLAPRLLEAAQATGAPDEAFRRFADFFSSLTMGVQVQSLFLAQPVLFELIVRVMAFAPRLAAFLARSPAALDSLMDNGFFAPFAAGEIAGALTAGLARAGPGYEAAMNAARRLHREQTFRIGVQVMSGSATAAEAGPAFADLADACIRGLAGAALTEVERLAGALAGEVAVIALGRCGSREMTAGSDLDLMTIYDVEPGSTSDLKTLSPGAYYARFTQRLIAALSAPTAEGGLYEVDMRLRPSGAAGPVAVSRAAFGSYYAGEAETWEFLALTRARVVWASSAAFAAAAQADIEIALRQPRDAASTAKNVREMRALMAKELPPSGFWDLKRSPGGLIDIEFAAQYLQIIHAARGGPLRASTGEALAAIHADQLMAPRAATLMLDAWRLQQDLSQLLKVALAEDADPGGEPAAFKALLAKAGGCADYDALRARLKRLRIEAHKMFNAVVSD
jgi:glutamate-ammonia-ligase adenylyltransferase